MTQTAGGMLTRSLPAAATADGDVVVWEQQGGSALPGTRPRDRVAIKVMRLHNGPITLLTTSGPHLVSGEEVQLSTSGQLLLPARARPHPQPVPQPQQLASTSSHPLTPRPLTPQLGSYHSHTLTPLTSFYFCIIPTGGADGYVRFYDCLLRLVAWFEDLAAGPVASLSFSPPAFEGAIVPPQSLGQFVAPDFVVGTTEGKVRPGGAAGCWLAWLL